MTRSLLTLAFASLLLVACSTTQPSSHSAYEPVEVDPVTDPTLVGALDEAVLEAAIEGAAAAETGRRIGQVAGVLAAVFGGSSHEPPFAAIDRYWETRVAIEDTATLIGVTKGAVEGAKRGYQLDLQFAELHAIEGVAVTRPYPDEIYASFASDASDELLTKVAAVFADREERAVDIEAPGDEAAQVRDALIDRGVPASGIEAHRNDELSEVVVRIRYRG